MRYAAFIGLGSNLDSQAGTSTETVRAAIQTLGALGSVVAESSLYRTAPVGYREQPDFINAVVELSTELEPERLLNELLTIERSFGRDRSRSIPNGPRTLDLDILLMFGERGDAVLQESRMLRLPHPEIARRRFVLEPLAEIAPRLRHPMLRKTIRQLLEELPAVGRDGDAVERI